MASATMRSARVSGGRNVQLLSMNVRSQTSSFEPITTDSQSTFGSWSPASMKQGIIRPATSGLGRVANMDHLMLPAGALTRPCSTSWGRARSSRRAPPLPLSSGPTARWFIRRRRDVGPSSRTPYGESGKGGVKSLSKSISADDDIDRAGYSFRP
jgi:hypothetical protein